MLLKFSNILALLVTTWHLEVGHVADLALQLIVAGAGRLVFSVARDIGSNTRTEAIVGGLGLQGMRVSGVLTWSWHLRALDQIALQLDAHGEIGARLLSESVFGLVVSGAGDIEFLLVLELGTHVEAGLVFEGGRFDCVVSSGRDRSRLLFVEHLTLVAAETVVRGLGLNDCMLRVVLDLGVDALGADARFRSLRSSEAIVGRRLQGLGMELIVAGSWDQLVFTLLELVMVQR